MAKPLSASDRLLIVRLGAIGDVLRTLPAVHLIRTTFPKVHIAWLVEALSHDLLRGHPEIDELILFDRRAFGESRGTIGLARHLGDVARDLRARRFGVVADFQGTFKSALLARLTGAPLRFGFAPGHCREMSFLLSNRWVRPQGRRLNRVDKNLSMADALGARGDSIVMTLPESPEEARAAETLLLKVAPQGQAVVLMSAGTSRRQSHKRWPAGSYARVASLLRARLDAVPLICWGPGEESLAREVQAASNGLALIAPAIPLRELAALLRRSALFIGADTGPMHLAWGVGCPVVALFGPTDPALNGPLGRPHAVLMGGGSTARIPSEAVFDAAQRLLAQRTPVASRQSPLRLPRHTAASTASQSRL